MEDSKILLEKAMHLKPEERFLLIEGLIESLDKPDLTLDDIWQIEAEKRLNAYRAGKLKGISYENIFPTQ